MGQKRKGHKPNAKSKAAYVKKIHTGYTKLRTVLLKHDPAFVKKHEK